MCFIEVAVLCSLPDIYIEPTSIQVCNRRVNKFYKWYTEKKICWYDFFPYSIYVTKGIDKIHLFTESFLYRFFFCGKRDVYNINQIMFRIDEIRTKSTHLINYLFFALLAHSSVQSALTLDPVILCSSLQSSPIQPFSNSIFQFFFSNFHLCSIRYGRTKLTSNSK